MNPTANKSDFEDLTTNLRDLAYSYLEKYSPSKQQLKVHLLKKYFTNSVDDSICRPYAFRSTVTLRKPKGLIRSS